eukprot:jgi/Chrzof1/3605/Cz13g02030.t1
MRREKKVPTYSSHYACCMTAHANNRHSLSNTADVSNQLQLPAAPRQHSVVAQCHPCLHVLPVLCNTLLPASLL